jgi:hypothetical protein
MITVSDLIIGFTGIATAVATGFLVQSTNKLLFQQKKEENIKYNPYLNIDDFKVEINSLKKGFHVSFNIKNSGVTPAHKLKIGCEFIINGISSFNASDGLNNFYTIVMPNAIRKFNRYCDEEILNKIKNNSGDCEIIITLNYYNYNNDCINLKNTISLTLDKSNSVFDHGYKKQDLEVIKS